MPIQGTLQFGLGFEEGPSEKPLEIRQLHIFFRSPAEVSSEHNLGEINPTYRAVIFKQIFFFFLSQESFVK